MQLMNWVGNRSSASLWSTNSKCSMRNQLSMIKVNTHTHTHAWFFMEVGNHHVPLNHQKASLFIWLISTLFIIEPAWPTHLSPSLQKRPLSFWWWCDRPLCGCLSQTWHTASTLWWDSPVNSWLITVPHLNESKREAENLRRHFLST